MNVQREVILDLVPLYLSGEASPATKQLVEQYAQQHTDIADLISDASVDVFAEREEYSLPKELEMKSMERTKLLLRIRSIILGISIFLSLLPLSIRGSSEGVRWLWSGAEGYALAIGALAAFAWFSYAILHRKLRSSGW